MARTKEVKSLPQKLAPYTTCKTSFEFYFPQQGDYSHFPSNVSIGDKVTAKGQTYVLKVATSR